MQRHLLIYISAHGFGHIAQTAPIVDALRQDGAALRISVCSAASAAKLRERLGDDVHIEPVAADVGMVQRNALELDLDASARAYSAFHSNWAQRLEDELRRIERLAPDLILSNVSYLGLAAAQRLGVPAVALCSLNWAEIYSHFFAAAGHESAHILTQMLDAYNGASGFLAPEPRMNMAMLDNLQPIGPIAQLGRPRRAELRHELGLAPNDNVVVVSLGGMAFRPRALAAPAGTGVRVIVPAAWQMRQAHAVDLERLDMPFTDVLRSSDALVAKPGYGSFVEAACAGVPVLYLERPDWPEVPVLVQWLQQNGRCAPLGRAQFEAGTWLPSLELLWCQPAVRPPTASGVRDAVRYLRPLLA